MRINTFLFTALVILSAFNITAKPKLCITMDDPNMYETPLLNWHQRNDMILETLKKYDLKAALFVCGMRIDSDSGRQLIQKWDDEGHMICNHSYSHWYYPSKKISVQDFEKNFLRCDSIIRNYINFTKLFRYPFLKEGDDLAKRDGFREFLKSMGYKNGRVAIDASDWYVDSRMIKALKEDAGTDTKPYKEFYLQHMLDRAKFYNELAVELTGREIPLTMLIHHSLLNAMFLDELIAMFIQNGWEVVNASDAFKDSIYSAQPDVLPAGESIIWSIAKATGKYESQLRYPGEDGEYEEAKLNDFLASYKGRPKK